MYPILFNVLDGRLRGFRGKKLNVADVLKEEPYVLEEAVFAFPDMGFSFMLAYCCIGVAAVLFCGSFTALHVIKAMQSAIR